jgi:hypothetical protein
MMAHEGMADIGLSLIFGLAVFDAHFDLIELKLRDQITGSVQS